MNKYGELWHYIGDCDKDKVSLTFEEIENIVGIPVDHSFLRYKKELNEYGYEVKKIFMKEQKIVFERIERKSDLILYVHGKGGTPNEVEHYKSLFPCHNAVGLDYNAKTPWEAKAEFPSVFERLSENYDRVILIANSIGAYFSMCTLPQEKIEKAYFISPVVDMEKLICNMMKWANVTEDELSQKGEIETDFGETLSWEYLSFIRDNPIKWNVPTEILYGGKDNLTDMETMRTFANKHGAKLTVMQDGEHWFHTAEQMEFLDSWIKGTR